MFALLAPQQAQEELAHSTSLSSIASTASSEQCSMQVCTCARCGTQIDGTTYMFNDQSFCCERHRVQALQAQRALIDERRKNAKRTPFRNRFGGGSSTSGSGNCDGSANSGGDRKEFSMDKVHRDPPGLHLAGNRTYCTWI